MTWVLEVWRDGAWFTLATFADKFAARTRAWELRLVEPYRVREVGTVG